MATKISVLLAIIFLVILGFLKFNFNSDNISDDKVKKLAQCLAEKNVKMYGAFWCPHCKKQKKMFGKSWKYIKYIECSTPNGQSQTEECDDAKIDGYPTWEFPDGSRQSGEVQLSVLADKSGCEFMSEEQK